MGQHDKYVRLIDKLDRKFKYSDLYKRYITLGISGELSVSYDLLDNEEEFKPWISIGIYKVDRLYNINGSYFYTINTVLYVSDSFILSDMNILGLLNTTFVVIKSDYNYKTSRDDDLALRMFLHYAVRIDCDIFIDKLMKVYCGSEYIFYHWDEHTDISHLDYLLLHNIKFYCLNKSEDKKGFCVVSYFKTLLSENETNFLEELSYVFDSMYKIFYGFNIEWKVRMNTSLLDTFLDLFQSENINIDSLKNVFLNICLELVYNGIQVDLQKFNYLNTIFKDVNINYR